MTLDLQRIVEALKACRERYYVRLNSHGTAYRVFDHAVAANVFYDTQDGCEQWVDARCAEAMVRAMTDPSEVVIEAGTKAVWDEAFVSEYPTYDPEEINRDACRDSAIAAWSGMCDAILGETQPDAKSTGNWSYNNPSLTGVQVSPSGGARQEPETAKMPETSTAQGGDLPISPAPVSETQP